MRFSDIPAHESIKERLRAMAASKQIPHALLFEGPTGSFKLSLARAFAQYLHCSNPTSEGDSCGKCPSCLQHQSMNHIDTIYVYPVIKSDQYKHPVSDEFAPLWRDFLNNSPAADIDVWTKMLDKKNARPIIYVDESVSLIHKLSFTGHSKGYRIIILWLPERMNEECANKLLKLIEEPFPDTLFLMVSDNPREILPTIYSRTQHIELKRLPDNVVSHLLIEDHSVDPIEANAIAHTAFGDINTALRQLNLSSETQALFDCFVKLMRLSYQRKVGELKNWSSDLAGEGREFEVRFYDYAQRLIRENFIYNFNTPELNYMTRTEGSFSVNFARFINEVNVEQLINVFNKALTDIAANANGKIVNFDVALKVCFLLKHQ